MSFCYINGSYKNNIDALISVEDRGFNFSDGIYEVMGFRNGKLLNFERHLKRLSKSLIDLQIKAPFSNENSLKIIIHHLLKLNDVYSGFLYLQITRGTAKRNHLFPSKVKPNIVIFTFSKVGLDKIKKGVNVGLTKDQRWMRCDIKSISLLANVLLKQKALKKKAFECLMKDNNGFITEATTSNVWILKNNVLITTPLTSNILAGVTRKKLIQLAKRMKITVLEKKFKETDVLSANGVFITNSSAIILEANKLNNKKLNVNQNGIIKSIKTEMFKVISNE